MKLFEHNKGKAIERLVNEKGRLTRTNYDYNKIIDSIIFLGFVITIIFMLLDFDKLIGQLSFFIAVLAYYIKKTFNNTIDLKYIDFKKEAIDLAIKNIEKRPINCKKI